MQGFSNYTSEVGSTSKAEGPEIRRLELCDCEIMCQSWYVKFAQKLGLSSGSIVKNLA